MVTKSNAGSPGLIKVVLLKGEIKYAAATFFDYHTCNDSPFADGYDYIREEQVVKEMLSEGADANHPRIADFEGRMTEMKYRIKFMRKDDGGAINKKPVKNINLSDFNIVINSNRNEAEQVQVGKLVSKEVPTVRLHTAVAIEILKGRPLKKSDFGFPGVKSRAAALKDLFFLSMNGNPFADKILIDSEKQLKANEDFVLAQTKHCAELFLKARKRGINLTVLENESEHTFEADFSSPYAASLQRLITDYDYLIRLVLSLSRGGQMSAAEKNTILGDSKRKIISANQKAVGRRRLMNHPVVLPIRTNYWISGNEKQRAILLQASQAIGAVKFEVLSKAKKPMFARNASINEKDLPKIQETCDWITNTLQQLKNDKQD